jgi:hypothetical protein
VTLWAVRTLSAKSTSISRRKGALRSLALEALGKKHSIFSILPHIPPYGAKLYPSLMLLFVTSVVLFTFLSTNISCRKSQIAIEFAHKFKQKYSQVFWVQAANAARFGQAYQNIAEKLSLPGWKDPKINIYRVVYEWLSNEDHGCWLMILDNADEREIFFPRTIPDESNATTLLAAYIPRSSKGSVLITTRNRNLGKDLANGETSIEIQPFAPPEAELLLKSRVSDDGWNVTDAGELLETLGYIPLAITQASAFVSQHDLEGVHGGP